MKSERVGQWLGNGLRARTLARCTAEANDIKLIWLLAQHSRRENAHQLGALASPSGTVLGSTRFTQADLDDLAAREVAAWAGVSVWNAATSIAMADVLCTDLTATLDAVAAGRLDLARARVLVDAVADLPRALRVKVEKVLLDQLATDRLAGVEGLDRIGPWDAPAPRSWAQKVNRAVMMVRVRVRTADQVQDEARALTGTSLQVHRDSPALSTFTVTGPTAQLVCAQDVLSAAARAVPDSQRDGRTLGQIEVDLLFRSLVGDAPGSSVGPVRRELGLVMQADTLLDDGPAADDPGEVRGTSVGAPVPVDAGTARVLADQVNHQAPGTAGASTCLLLTDDLGHLTRILRIGRTPETGWTRTTLMAAGRAALAKDPEPTDRAGTYRPSTPVAELVRARDPVCTFPGCGVAAGRADLDHTIPHPRGPTSVQNLSPRSRRCHRYKTAGLWHVTTRTAHDGHVSGHRWTSPLGAHQDVEVPPLPGHGPGEAYART